MTFTLSIPKGRSELLLFVMLLGLGGLLLFSCSGIRTVDSAYLCDNIDQAFRVWRGQPWGKHVSFADFCECILPYRIGDETLGRWREEFYRTYNPLLDSLRASATLDKEAPAVATRVLLDSLRGDENDSHQWISVADKYGTPRSRIAYLCASRRMDWEPVAWADFSDESLVFTDIQKGSVMRVATYEQGKLRYWTDPFEVGMSGKFHFFTPSDSVRDVVLFAKYTLRGEGMFQERMIGGRFEGSDRPDFIPAETLHVIDAQPMRLQTVVHLHPSRAYRYVRYIGPDGSHCNIAEAAFYAPSDTAALKGRVIGTPGCYQKDGSHEYTNVFDGNFETSFDYIEPSGGWSGLDLGTPQQISKIVYTPRSYDNYVRPGDRYELFYCAGRKWISLGKQKAGADSLAYKEVPDNVLLLLRNYSRGTQERIFMYEEGKQVWK